MSLFSCKDEIQEYSEQNNLGLDSFDYDKVNSKELSTELQNDVEKALQRIQSCATNKIRLFKASIDESNKPLTYGALTALKQVVNQSISFENDLGSIKQRSLEWSDLIGLKLLELEANMDLEGLNKDGPKLNEIRSITTQNILSIVQSQKLAFLSEDSKKIILHDDGELVFLQEDGSKDIRSHYFLKELKSKITVRCD